MATARTVRWLAVALLLVVLAAILWFFEGDRSGEMLDPELDPALAPARSEPAHPQTPDETERRSVESVSSSQLGPTKRAAEAPVETRVYGSILDRSGRTIQGTWWAAVLFVDANGKRQHVDTKEKGTYEFRGL